MRKDSFIGRLLSFIISALCSVVAFVKDHYMPERDFRLDGFINKATSTVSAVAHQAKAWSYAMYARWHVDSYRLA